MQRDYSIYDCHLHVEQGLEDYDLSIDGANVIFNSLESYNTNKNKYAHYHHSLIFKTDRSPEFYNQLISEKKIIALKIHSRLQEIQNKDYAGLIKALKSLEKDIPIIFDAFYYGGDLEVQPSLSGLIEMIQAFPGRRFIVAHAGGYEILKYFFHLKGYEQVGFDLSLTLQYLNDSSCRADIVKLIRFLPGRVFFGTDYPAASPSKQETILQTMVKELNLDEEEIQGVLSNNWREFLGIK